MKTFMFSINSVVLAAALVLSGAAHAQTSTENPDAPVYGTNVTASSGSQGYYYQGETSCKAPRTYQSRDTVASCRCEDSANEERGRKYIYEHCGYTGTGPRIAGRY